MCFYITFHSLQAGDSNSGAVKSVKLVLHGTRDMPNHVRRAGGSRVYNNNYNDVIEPRMVS